MDNTTISQLIQIGSSITTSGFLLLAWYYERKRVDALMTFILQGKRDEMTRDLIDNK